MHYTNTFKSELTTKLLMFFLLSHMQEMYKLCMLFVQKYRIAYKENIKINQRGC